MRGTVTGGPRGACSIIVLVLVDHEITQDTTLDADVARPTGPALVIAADNVTLDLGGHTVSGDPAAPNGAPGIVLRDVHGCTVRNGTVEHFSAGVFISGGGGNVIEHVTVQDNIGTTDGDFGDGIVIDSSTENRIQHNTVRRNGPFSGISLVQDCERNEVRDNVVADNNMMHTGDPVAGRQAIGIRLEGPGANHNRVIGNQVSGSGSNGITIHPTCNDVDACAGTPPNEHNEIVHNTANHNGTSGRGDGIKLFSLSNPVPPTHNRVRHNVANHNATYGIAFDRGTSQNEAADNKARNNGEHDGYDGNVAPACGSNIWDANDFGLVNQPCVRRPMGTAASGMQTFSSALRPS